MGPLPDEDAAVLEGCERYARIGSAGEADPATGAPDHSLGSGVRARRVGVLASGWRERLTRSVAGGQRGLMALALLVGAGAGLGAIAFRYMILGFTYLFTGHRDYSAVGHAINPLVPGLGIWFVLLVPVIGGLIYGPLVSRFAPEARGHGVPEVMYAVSRQGGRMRPQVPVVKSLASAVCIGSGGSVGREGPIVQIGSALGSVPHPPRQTVKPYRRLRQRRAIIDHRQ